MNEVDKAVDNLYDWSTRLKYISVILSALGEVLRVRHDRKNLQKLLFPERTFLASYPRQDFPGGFADIRNARRPDAAQYATVSRKDRQSVEIYIYSVTATASAFTYASSKFCGRPANSARISSTLPRSIAIWKIRLA